MKVPAWLSVLLALLALCGVGAFCLKLFTGCTLLGDVANLALVLTLAALLVYVYCTYMLAVEAWTISASFELVQLKPDPYRFAFILRNHSKHSLKCWCNLNTTTHGKSVSLGGFYAGESSFDLQPFAAANGWFDIRQILAKANSTVEEMREKSGSCNPKEQLYFDIEFWYSPTGRKEVIVRNPRQPHYYNFQKGLLIADF